mmetsp:Transcript_25615/g.38267  ORF Transcript_25615/g.38267 Transcript_25615/m.38267 type:complete len:410 (-) Transcript_25615:1756-2985(-)
MIPDATVIVPNKLYFLPQKSAHIIKSPGHDYFTIDDKLIYWNFFRDFGPLNLGQLYRFCGFLNDKMERKHPIVFHAGPSCQKITNAVCLILSWLILYRHSTPNEVYLDFRELFDLCVPFHDASNGTDRYGLTPLDTLRGLYKAYTLRFFRYDDTPDNCTNSKSSENYNNNDDDVFNLAEYEHFECVEHGDLNWIVHPLHGTREGICAFAGPHYEASATPEGYVTLSTDSYIDYFLKKNVKLVLRLNKKMYDENDFIERDINHAQHIYTDGSVPNIPLLQEILKTMESSRGGLAVHCKAGLGRTGTVIGAFLMKHYKFSAAECIGWMRVCRPGMVIGPQQHFLAEIEQMMWYEGDVHRLQVSRGVSSKEEQDKRSIENCINTQQIRNKMEELHIDKSQADGLLRAKARGN